MGSALYHHVPNKQTLLAAVADEILLRGRRVHHAQVWDQRVIELCVELRDAMLAYRDGADVVATAHTFGLGAATPATDIRQALRDGGLPEDLADLGTRTLLHLVFGHTMEEQTALQAASAGAIDRTPGGSADFEQALELVLDGLRSKLNRTKAPLLRSPPGSSR